MPIRRLVRRAVALAAVCVTPLMLAAQTVAAPTDGPPAAPLDTSTMWRVQVSVLTFGQGSPIFERFGHNAIRIFDPLSGLDVAYNWGMFDFDQPNFVGRFVSGNTQYWMEGFPTEPLLAYYRANNRTAEEQVLNLSGAQKAEILRFVRWNALEANKYYRYDYFRDNCSTRVRDVLDKALGGALKRAWADSLSTQSFRSEALRLTEESPVGRLGIDIALGPPADARMTAWEELYIPMRLRDRLRGVMVPGPGNTMVKLVEKERRIFDSTRLPEPANPMRLPGLYVAVALGSLVPLALFGGLAFMSALRGRWEQAQRVARMVIAVVSAVWYALCGLLGTLVVFMEFFSQHVFWYGNWNVLLLSPAALAAAWFVPRAILRGERATQARWVAGFCAVSALVALAMSITGMTGQSSGGVAVAFAPTMMYLGLIVPALTLIARPRA